MAAETVQSVKRAFSVLEILAKDGTQSISELHDKLKLHSTTIYRMLTTLQELGYVQQIEENGKYYLSYKIVVLAHETREWNTVAKLSTPFLRELVDGCGETVHLVQRVDTRVRYIAKIEPNNSTIQMGSFVGMELPMHATAVGKSIMARLPDDEVAEIWKKSEKIQYTKNTISSLKVLNAQLKEIRQTEIAFDDEEREVGLFCLATCINNFEGKPFYALSISAPKSRLNQTNMDEYCKKLKTTGHIISQAIGAK